MSALVSDLSLSHTLALLYLKNTRLILSGSWRQGEGWAVVACQVSFPSKKNALRFGRFRATIRP